MIDYDRFCDCITILCDGMSLHPDLREGYKTNKDLIVEIQDHIGFNCKLTYVHNFPTMAVIEMAEAYASY